MTAIKKPLRRRKGGVLPNLCASASDPKVLCAALAVYGTELFKAICNYIRRTTGCQFIFSHAEDLTNQFRRSFSKN